jgi:hypothetical protein
VETVRENRIIHPGVGTIKELGGDASVLRFFMLQELAKELMVVKRASVFELERYDI